MLAKVFSAASYGLEAYLVEVEVDIFWGLPGISLVGLPDTAVQESKERVRSAVKHSGYQFPGQRITINMAPANTRKSGPSFDLAVAVGLLLASEQLLAPEAEEYLLLGELSLSGKLRPIKGLLALALAGLRAGKKKVIVPKINAPELALIPHLQVFPAESLEEVCQHLNQTASLQVQSQTVYSAQPVETSGPDLKDVRGQIFAKRALEIAAAGSHNLLMVGPPGSGKTMLAHRLPSILPPLSFTEALESHLIYSVNGSTESQKFLATRPFRAPHHSIAKAGLIGGSSPPRPGEISLAHHGVLFLDELPEFAKPVLELLRQPLETGEITLSRANRTFTYPAQCQVVAAMNPCPCGFWGDTHKICQCSPHTAQRYWRKLSGPLLDRFDLQIEVARLPAQELNSKRKAEPSHVVFQRVMLARERQAQRFREQPSRCNAKIRPEQIESFCALPTKAQTLLQQATEKLGLSARSHAHLLKIARTIADLENQDQIQTEHLLEAIQFRSLERRQGLTQGVS